MKSKFLKLGLCLAVTLAFSSMEVMAQKNNDWARLAVMRRQIKNCRLQQRKRNALFSWVTPLQKDG